MKLDGSYICQVIFARFEYWHNIRNFPISWDRPPRQSEVKKFVSGRANSIAHSLSILGGILSGPDALLTSIDWSSFATSSAVQDKSPMTWSVSWLRFWKSLASESLMKTDWKKLLKRLTLSSGEYAQSIGLKDKVLKLRLTHPWGGKGFRIYVGCRSHRQRHAWLGHYKDKPLLHANNETI